MGNLIFSADSHYLDDAWREMQRATKGAKLEGKLNDGIALVRHKGSFEQLGEHWHNNPPIFVRHICPATEAVEVDGSDRDLDLLARTVRDQLADEIPTSSRFSVQTRLLLANTTYKRFALNERLAQVVERQTGATVDVRRPNYVVSVVIGRIHNIPVGFLGVSQVHHNLSDWAGGERRFRREKEQISRAEFKLLEALEQFGVRLPDKGVALDLGAAPGGWTRVLRQTSDELLVVAVDPANLHPSLKHDWGVHHLRTTADRHLNTIKGDARYDVIVNDMRLDARRSAETMTHYAPTLKPNGCAIMTIKLPQDNTLRFLNQTLDILRRKYVVKRVRQLFHNRHEVTTLLRPK